MKIAWLQIVFQKEIIMKKSIETVYSKFNPVGNLFKNSICFNSQFKAQTILIKYIFIAF